MRKPGQHFLIWTVFIYSLYRYSINVTETASYTYNLIILHERLASHMRNSKDFFHGHIIKLSLFYTITVKKRL